MAKRKGGKSGGGRDGRPPGSGGTTDSSAGSEELDLLQSLRMGLMSDEPLELLATVSGMIELTDPRRADPFRADERPSLVELVDSFQDAPFPETTAVLTIIRALVPDELMRARIGRVLSRRGDPLPTWLTGLDQARIDPEVWFLTDVLGDGDDFFFGVTLPTGHQLSALVYVDHNLGTMVKDAFVVPESLAELLNTVVGTVVDQDQDLSQVDPADARASVEQAIESSAQLYPPVESDSWPMCRPVIEWMLRMLPAGGMVPERPEWSEEELTRLADDFFASPYGMASDDHERRGMLESILWFATDYGPGDPLRWSPVAVEMLLLDWVPRKIITDPGFLGRLPELVRDFIRYAHHRRGIRSGRTVETLAALDETERRYVQRIRASTPYGAAAMLENLAELVGGHVGLEGLTAESLPDEPFAWDGIPDDIRPLVGDVLTSCDGCAEALLDVEHRTAMRRFLSRAAVADPVIFRRKASPVRGAAAVAWVICRANNTAGGSGSPLSVQELLDWFGVNGSVSQRAEPLLRANGVHPSQQSWGSALGTPDLLVSGRREEIIEWRNRYRDL